MFTSSLMKPLVLAINQTISSVYRRFISSTLSRSAAQYEATVNSGLEVFASDEIKRKFEVDSRILQGRVVFETDAKLNDILKLRSINNLFVIMYDETLEDKDMPTDSDSLERLLFRIGDKCDWRSGLEKWLEMSKFDCGLETLMTKSPMLIDRHPKFRVSSLRTGSDHQFTSPDLCSVFGHVIDTKFGWPVKMKGMDLDIYINFRHNRVYVNITLTPICLAYRNVQLTGLTTLKATTCYALLRRANIRTGDILVDPMAGSGAIPLESCDCYHDNEMLAMTIGGELRKQTLRKCCMNMKHFEEKKIPRPPSDFVRLDVTRMPFPDNSIDVFVSDLPFGQRHGSKKINKQLYPALLRDMGRAACISSGRAILLTQDHKNMMDAYSVNRDLWSELSTDEVKVGNLKCFIYLFSRTDSPFIRS